MTQSFDVGAVFTNGTSFAEIVKGPVTIKKVEPVMEGDSVRLIGTLVRLLDDTTGIPHDLMAGWPPTHPEMLGGVDPKGFVMPAPPGTPVVKRDDGKVQIEIQFGYEVVAPGRTVRKGIYITYEFDGDDREVFIPSYASFCAPMTAPCPFEDHHGTDADPGEPGSSLPSWDPSASPSAQAP